MKRSHAAVREPPSDIATVVASQWRDIYREVVVSRLDWVLLAYRLPREPSTPRISLWRKLRRLGAVQVLDGLVALPADARTKEQLEWLADEVLDSGGEASVWLGRPGSVRDERVLATKMADAISGEYGDVLSRARAAADEPSTGRRRTVERLRRELSRIERRDFFPPPERELARRAVDELALVTEEAP